MKTVMQHDTSCRSSSRWTARGGFRPRLRTPGIGSSRLRAWAKGQPVEDRDAVSNLQSAALGRNVQRRALLGGLGMLPCGCALCSRAATNMALLASNGTAPVGSIGAALPPGRRQWYDRYFAYAMATGMEDYEAAIAPTKQELFRALPATGTVLEVGIGTGPNLRWYNQAGGAGLCITGVDPNTAMFGYARTAAAAAGFAEQQLHLVAGQAEALPLEDGCFDAAVITLVLCSVQSPSVVLKEIARVLRPGGRLVLIEHVFSEQLGWLQLQQRLLEPLQRLAADGCHLTRRVQNWGLARSGLWGATPERGLHSFEVEGMGLIAPHVAGVLTRTELM